MTSWYAGSEYATANVERMVSRLFVCNPTSDDDDEAASLCTELPI
jgi:hypothetical protein